MINVFVVDDEELTAAAHAEYVKRCPGFRVVGVALTGQAAARAILQKASGPDPVHLVLQDINLPDMSGLDVARTLRARRVDVDFMIVSAHRDAGTVRGATALGVVGYLIKPFTFAVFERKLASYAEYHRLLSAATPASTTFDQSELDRAFATMQDQSPPKTPKGLSPETLDSLVTALQEAGQFRSAAELAKDLGLSRVTARRYLEHLTEKGTVQRRSRHGTPGRPELEYGWNG
ncbi:response regulator [Kocuria atrinae]|uniref:response regulator n=1 Tax=Kocuria atrinae TaxID=592377 RepID=UPI00031BAC94|nr:response regulator [Kocuria atrinae]